MSSIRIEYARNGVPFASRSRNFVPRVGEQVQLTEGVFAVKLVTYIENGFHGELCYVEVEERRKANRYGGRANNDDNYGNY